MGDRVTRWISTEKAATSIGMTARWVRQQIEAKRLPAYAIETGTWRTSRIRTDDSERLLTRYRRRTNDPDWAQGAHGRPHGLCHPSMASREWSTARPMLSVSYLAWRWP